MKSSNRRLSVFIALMFTASSALMGVAHAANHSGDAQVQARELLDPTRATHVIHSTQPASAYRAEPAIDVQEQARGSILGTPSALTARAVDTNRSSRYAFGRAHVTRPFADAQVTARRMILGVRVGPSSNF